MASEWDHRPFGEICEHSAFGPRFSGELYSPEGNVATLRTTDISADGRIDVESMPLAILDLSKLEQHVLRVGDLVITRTGRVGSTAVFSGFRVPVLPGAFLIRFRLQRAIADAQFYRYFFMSPSGQQQIESVATGSVQKNLNITNLHRLSVPVPPLREQQAIAGILVSLDDKIELNRRRSRTLEAMARAIFKSWFVDLDPVRAKAAGRAPAGLSPALAALFPDRLEDSPLGPIPAGWRVGTVGEHFDLTMGQSPPGETYNETGDGLPFYQGRTDFGFRFPKRRVYCTAPTRLARTGDTLVSVRAPVGDVNIANEACAIGRGVAAVRHKGGSRSMTYHAMHNLGDHFGRFEAEGTVFGSINKAAFEKLPFVAADRHVVAAFDHACGPLDDQVEVLERETATLASLRDTLLPKLISGALRVPDAERIVGRVQ